MGDPSLTEAALSSSMKTFSLESIPHEPPLDSTLSSPLSGLPSPPPHRSHDPSTNLKRSDPFQFGSRYLLPTDDVFEFNAWDHVETDDVYNAHAEAQYTNQRANPVSAYDKHRFNADPEKWWNRFYNNNASNFFKDRKWLHQEFPVLREVTGKDAGEKIVLEVGAGAGNSAFPIIRANENERLVLHACDFSRKAVELIKSSEMYNAIGSKGHMEASVWDICSSELPGGLSEGSVDVVLLIFVFSALSPQQWDAAVRNVYRVLKPGGEICFRDYGKGDLAQVRFRKGRWMEENFYVRGDGTLVYFFGQDELRDIWGGVTSRATNAEDAELRALDERQEAVLNTDAKVEEEGGPNGVESRDKQTPSFEIMSLGVDRRLLVNRQKQLKMYRCWMQGRFRKSALLDPSHASPTDEKRSPSLQSSNNGSR